MIASEQVYRVMVMLHHAPGMSAAQIGAAIGSGALLFLCLRTACFALMIVGASFLAFASRREAQDRAPQIFRHDGGDPRRPGFWTL